MTSISAASAQSYQSPLQKLQDELLSEVKSGAIKSSDQDALASALTDIDFGDTGQPGHRPGQRHAVFARRSEVEDRRPHRERSFQRQADQRSGHRTAGHLQGGVRQRTRRRRGGAGGPPPGGPPPSGDASSSDDTSSSSSTSIDDILKQFLQSLQETLSASSSTSYSATGTTSSSSTASFSALLIDYQS